MDMMECRDYRFVNGTFVTDGCVYGFKIMEADGFYNRMKKFIGSEKVEGQTDVVIDEITITDNAKTFFDEKSFALNAQMIANYSNADGCRLFSVVINNVKLKENRGATRTYADGFWEIKSYSLEMPWHTTIVVKEILSDDDDAM